MMPAVTVQKLPKNRFKCFHCRHVFAQRDGDWYDWSGIQVHLCRPCEKTTDKTPERIKKTT